LLSRAERGARNRFAWELRTNVRPGRCVDRTMRGQERGQEGAQQGAQQGPGCARRQLGMRSECDGVACKPAGDDISRWKALIHGAAGTPYEGGHFVLHLHLPKDFPYGYPWVPPEVRFATKVWHPNVCPKTGAMCFGQRDWSPALSIQKTVILAQALLSHPEPREPDRVNQVINTVDSGLAACNDWRETARLWTRAYAWFRCGCIHCRKREEAFLMGLHPRLGRHCPLAQLHGAVDLAWLIASFSSSPNGVTSDTCISWTQQSFLREWG
jgi:ubiquitin-protein ligase